MRDGRTPPASLGPYAIERELGHGGMATVYLARDPRHDRPVAIKVLRPELTQALGVERFQREVAITANLTHPNILPLHDSGAADGQLYYVMPFVEGESLRDRLQHEQQLPLRDAVCIAQGVASALEHAHAHGIVHRDIKPENILLSGGQPIVADFGIARVLEESVGERITSTGVSLGSPTYMSPEQASGDRAIDPRSDLYSLGCVLYEMLAGEPPFTGPTAQAIIAKRFAGTVPDIRTLRETVPPSLAMAVSRALAVVPADRFQSAAEMRAALDEAGLDCASPAMLERSRTGARSARQGLGRRAVRGAALAVAALAIVAFAAWREWGRGSATPEIRTLAVLPLTSISGGMGQDFLADGLTDALTTGISQLGSVNVISRTSVMQYAMMKKPLRDIAKGLHADGVLEGSVVRSGSRVRISAKLIRSSDERVLWAQSYERELGDALALQADVAEAVAREIGAKLVGGAPVRPRAVKPASQEAYLKGVYFAGQWRLGEAIKAFQEAVAVDPTHAAAYAALARAYYYLAFFGEVAPAEAFSQMRRSAERALEQDPASAEAHGLLALVSTHYDWDWAAAEQHFARALALNPNSAQVHHDYAHYLLAVGRQAESVRETRRALELDPANPMLTSCVGWHSLFDQKFDDALRYAAESQRMMPNFWAEVISGWADLGKGQNAEAVAAMRRAVRLSGGLPFTRAGLAHALAKAGAAKEARKELDQLLRQSLRGYVPAYDIAIVYAGLGENDRAFEWLAKAAGERSMFVVHLMWDSRLDGLRRDPRFAAIAKELAMPAPATPAT